MTIVGFFGVLSTTLGFEAQLVIVASTAIATRLFTKIFLTITPFIKKKQNYNLITRHRKQFSWQIKLSVASLHSGRQRMTNTEKLT
ncbi:hypothetical protein [Arsukibacterium ikkense]|uniref:hypothetical protein n=1 Tax=Arsukibacterium ikkense TaxID=336831 RepID=UPI00128B575B|nr:hypothetical protein [Arsukibacterium ikkense]